jgi:hypothetical protein
MLVGYRMADHYDTEIMSILDPEARRLAASFASTGEPFAAFHRSVCAIFGQGEDPAFAEEVIRIKGKQRTNRPLGMLLLSEALVSLIDPDDIPEALRHIFLDPDELRTRVGSLCFFRVPVRPDAAWIVPPHLVSRTPDGAVVIQSMDPRGHEPLDALIAEMRHQGVLYPAGTSLNASASPEIVGQEAGIAFARKAGIRLFLNDPLDSGTVMGSPTIISVTRDGLVLVRDGYIPADVFELLLESPVGRSTARPAAYPQCVFEPFAGVAPREIRTLILEQLNCHTVSHAAL